MRTPSRGFWTVLLLLLAVVAGVVAWRAIHVEAPAPDFALMSTGYENGVQGPAVNFTLQDYRGHTVVLDLMAVACTSCRDVTHSVLKPLAARHGASISILSIDTWADPGTGAALGGETRETLIAQQQRDDVPWRHALDTDQVWQKYSAVSLPRVVVVSPDGLVVYDHLGTPRLADVDDAVTASLAGSASQVPYVRLGLYGLAAVAGIASVLSPCSIGLLPAYFALLMAPEAATPTVQGADSRTNNSRVSRWSRIMLAGAACAVGILLVYAALALLFAVGGAWLQPWLPRMGPVIALAMIAAGIWALIGRGSGLFARLGSRLGHERGLLLFGTAFALCGFGCTGPLFLPILVAGFNISPSTGALLFLLYAGAVASVVLAIASLVATGADGPLRRLMRHSRSVQQGAAGLMIAAGAYLLWSFLRYTSF